MNDRPDVYTNKWWREQMKGVTHSVNRCNAEYASAADLIEILTTRVTVLEASLADAQMEIGKLREEVNEHVENIRKAYKKLKNGGNDV